MAWYAGAMAPLDDTLLRRTEPEELARGWRAVSEDGERELAEPSRPEAGRTEGVLRLRNELPDELPGNMSICFQTKNESVRVWVGSELVYEYGETPQRVYGHGVGSIWNLAALPEDAGGQTITVELSPIGGRTGLAPYRFLIGSRDGLVFGLIREGWLSLCVSALLGLIGLGALAMSLIGKLKRDAHANATFHFAFFVLLSTVWMFTDSGLMQFLIPHKGVSYLLFGCSFYLFCSPLSLFMAEMLPERRRVFRAFSLLNSAYALTRIALYASGALDFEAALWLLHLLMAMLILSINVIIWLPLLRARRFEPHELSLAVSVFTLVEGFSLIRFYVANKLNMLRNGYSSGFYIGILLFVLIVAIGVVRKARLMRRQAFRAEFLEKRAYTDDLTGLLNAKGFDDKYASAFLGVPAGEKCAVVDFDVNFFSQYNASNGIEAGDELLKKIAAALGDFCHEGELCARQEADHFVCMLRGDTIEDIIERVRVADKTARESMAARMLLISYGVVEARDRKLSPATLRNQAQMAKRAAKGNYERNIAVYDSALHEKQLREMELLSGFESALSGGRYVIFLQPKIDARTETLRGAEALVRHILPSGEVISAGSIIETLESKGFVSKLDYFIFEEVCKLLHGCLAEGRAVCPISSNFSRVHLFDPAFPERLSEIAGRYGVPRDLVELELTESAFLVGKDTLREMVRRLHGCGFRVAIDDFGSGYSSLNMLKDVDADALKLDREFLAGFAENSRALAVIENTLHLAQKLRITSVAEGVESADQLELLRRLKCDLIQGYYYSRPLPREEFIAKYLS